MADSTFSTFSVTLHHPSDIQLYPDSVFEGGFSVDSEAYAASCRFSGVQIDQPGSHQWQYDHRLITYLASCADPTLSGQFTLHHPVAIATGIKDHYHNPFTVYAIVRCIGSWSDSAPSTVNYSITVEVHVGPGFDINWSQTELWPFIPIGATFIYPHGFQTTLHQPLSIANTPLHNVITVQFDMGAQLDQMSIDKHVRQLMSSQTHTRS
jgi:hypothetical protein